MKAKKKRPVAVNPVIAIIVIAVVILVVVALFWRGSRPGLKMTTEQIELQRRALGMDPKTGLASPEVIRSMRAQAENAARRGSTGTPAFPGSR